MPRILWILSFNTRSRSNRLKKKGRGLFSCTKQFLFHLTGLFKNIKSHSILNVFTASDITLKKTFHNDKIMSTVLYRVDTLVQESESPIDGGIPKT